MKTNGIKLLWWLSVCLLFGIIVTSYFSGMF